MTRMLNVYGLPAYLLGVASLEPHTPDELLALACERHPELLTTAEDTTLRAAITNLHKADLLAREGKPYRYTITRAGEEEADRVYDERMKRGAA